MSKVNVRLEVSKLRDLIDKYWAIAYSEGLEGRDSDTEDKAQRCNHAIEASLKRLSESAE